MHQEDDINPFIDEMKDLKLRFKNAIINSNTYTSYADKLDLVCTHDIGKVDWGVIELDELIPKTLEEYSILKKYNNYDYFYYDRHQIISFNHLADSLVNKIINSKLTSKNKEIEELISQELFEYYLKTDIIAFNYDW